MTPSPKSKPSPTSVPKQKLNANQFWELLQRTVGFHGLNVDDVMCAGGFVSGDSASSSDEAELKRMTKIVDDHIGATCPEASQPPELGTQLDACDDDDDDLDDDKEPVPLLAVPVQAGAASEDESEDTEDGTGDDDESEGLKSFKKLFDTEEPHLSMYIYIYIGMCGTLYILACRGDDSACMYIYIYTHTYTPIHLCAHVHIYMYSL